ncbi:MAG: heat-shock protein Hsp20 [Candidatus Saccharibacteria bacterium]|nr:heat-shock protein Hsp20 [Candidatus Saccharibacteria bacterium]
MGDRGLSRRRDPFGGLTTIHSRIDDLFGDFFGGALQNADDSFPAMNVYTENDDRLVVEVNMSGFDPEDIEIHVHDDVLEVIGEKRMREEDRERGRRNYVVREMASTFFRSIRLPQYADGNNIDATIDNGILRIAIPFKESRQSRNIAIRDESDQEGRRSGGLGLGLGGSSRPGRNERRDRRDKDREDRGR